MSFFKVIGRFFGVVLGLGLSGAVLAEGNAPVQLSCTLVQPPSIAASAVPVPGNWGIQLIAGNSHETLLGAFGADPRSGGGTDAQRAVAGVTLARVRQSGGG